MILLKLWLVLPESFHRYLFSVLFFLWFTLRPKYRRRVNKRIEFFLKTHPAKAITARQVYWKLYFNLWQSYRFILNIKAPQLKIEGEILPHKTLYWSLHWGAFEALHPALAERIPLSVPVASKSELLNALRSNRGQKIIHMHDLKKLLRGLYLGENFALLIDQNPGPNFNEFELTSDLNMKTWTHLAQRAYDMGYLVCAFWCKVKKDPFNGSRYQLCLSIDPPFSAAKNQESKQRNEKEYNQVMGQEELLRYFEEKCKKKITEEPDFWVWHYAKSPTIKT